MIGLPQIRDIYINDYIKEIKNSLDSHNYLSALTLSLMIPDICSKFIGKKNKSGYVYWFNKYVYRTYYDIPRNKDIRRIKKEKGMVETYKIKMNGSCCYALRNAILHSGTPYIEYKLPEDKVKSKIDSISLCVNGDSLDYEQYGESVSIIRNNQDNTHVSIRLNVVNFCNTMINGYYDFIKEYSIEDTKLFPMIDWDYNKDAKITFTPKK